MILELSKIMIIPYQRMNNMRAKFLYTWILINCNSSCFQECPFSYTYCSEMIQFFWKSQNITCLV